MVDLGFLDPVRASYDVVAAGYSALFLDDLPRWPVKRSLLTLFAESVSGRVAYVGCGPGHVTAFLHGLGVDVFGIDLSSGMVEQARANYPELSFEVGSMTGLDHPDGSLSGVVSAMLAEAEAEAGFDVEVTTVHELIDVEQRRRAAFLIARKHGMNPTSTAPTLCPPE